MSTNAFVVRKHGPPNSHKWERIELPEPSDGQLTVRVESAGVNFPDTLIIEGKYQFQPEFPYSPGGEIAGVVSAVHGANKQGFKVGDRIMAMMGWGGFAEEVIIDADKAMAIPESMPFDVASGFAMTYGTTIHAFKQRAQLQPGETVLVLGAAGGVGVAAIEIAKAMGATVIAAASTDEKLQVCKDMGADHLINYSTEKLKPRLAEITSGKGVDVVYDPVGGKVAEQAVRSMAWKGRYLVIGFVAGIPKVPFNLFLLKGCSLVGVFWGRFTAVESEENTRNFVQLFNWFTQGQLKPLVSQQYPMSNAANALNDMLNRKVKGKAVLLPDHKYKASSKM